MLLSPVSNTSPDSTGSENELLDTAYVASARMHATVSHGTRPQWLTLTVTFTFVAKHTLPLSVILCLQLSYSG